MISSGDFILPNLMKDLVVYDGKLRVELIFLEEARASLIVEALKVPQLLIEDYLKQVPPSSS